VGWLTRRKTYSDVYGDNWIKKHLKGKGTKKKKWKCKKWIRV